MQYFLLFLDCSLNVMPSRLARAVAYVKFFFLYYSDSFIRLKNIPGGDFDMYSYIIIRSSINRHLDYPLSWLSIMNV